MNVSLEDYKKNVSKVFAIGVAVLSESRTLKSISLDLKLLALNGIVQAAKIGSHQGQSLITLSGFLSDLPAQIAPELEELEVLSNKLSRYITVCSMTVARYNQFSKALENKLSQIESENKKLIIMNSSMNLLDSNVLRSMLKSGILSSVGEPDKKNLFLIITKNLEMLESINELLNLSLGIIQQSKNKIERISRNGFIANYMGTSISIESAYLTVDKQDFESLVINIKNMVDSLNLKLDNITAEISKGEQLLKNLLLEIN